MRDAMTKIAVDPFRSGCPIASTLDLVGDRWSLVIVRDMINGKQRYAEFLESPERITTNILADRLKKLEATGLIEKRPYQDRPVRHDYRLTKMGEDLLPVLQSISRWANRHIADTWTPPASFMRKKPRAK